MGVKRVAGVLACAAVAVVTLSGCMDVQVDYTISSQATLESAQMVVSVDKSALAQLSALGSSFDASSSSPSSSGSASPSPISPSLGEFKQLVSSQSGASSDLDKYCSYSQSGTQFTMSCAFTAAQAPQMEQQTGDLALSLEGDSIRATLATKATSTPADAAAAGVSAVLRLHFPGPVESVSGPGVSIDAQDGTVAVIDGMAGDGTDVVVVASASEQDSLAGLLLSVIALAVLALIVIVAGVMIARHRRAVQDSDVVSDDVPSAPADAKPWSALEDPLQLEEPDTSAQKDNSAD